MKTFFDTLSLLYRTYYEIYDAIASDEVKADHQTLRLYDFELFIAPYEADKSRTLKAIERLAYIHAKNDMMNI